MFRELFGYVGSCQNYGPFLSTLNIRCRIIIRTQKGTIILTSTHVSVCFLCPGVHLSLGFAFGFGLSGVGSTPCSG